MKGTAVRAIRAIAVSGAALLCMAGLSLQAQTAVKALDPCKDPQLHPEYRQLDFWIGDWTVYKDKEKLSDVTVENILKGCALAETWTAAHGSDGRGLATYNPLDKKWEYFWVADRGYTSHFTGQLLQDEMQFVIEQPTPDGKTRLRHWSLIKLPDGRVRELSVGSVDNGQHWSTEYDFTWIRK
jgi:hypothetical protein